MYSPYAKRSLQKTLPNDMPPRIARPRGGRRQPTQPRPGASSNSPLSQSQSQSFPPPSWGANPSTTNAGGQQASDGFSFGQSPAPFTQTMNPTGSNNNQASSQGSSFPPFGGFNPNFAQEASAPASTGFNFAAPTTFNNPFANLNQNSNTQSTPSAVSGNFFNTPAKTTASLKEQSKEQEKLSAWERKPPSHWMTGLPADYQETDPQSFFVSHAPFTWGKPDQAQRATSETASGNVGQPTQQTSTNLFGQTEQSKQAPTDIFAHLQQPNSSAVNPFAQSAGQQSQTSNANAQQNTVLFQRQPDQTPSNPFAFLNGAAQGQNTSNIFNKPATSPTKDGDSMSTTPDTSPQSNNDRDRYGAFASVTGAPKPPLMNGSTPSGPGSNFFKFPSNPPTVQSFTTNTSGSSSNVFNAETNPKIDGSTPSDISLGSPTKKQNISARKIAQPTMGRPPVEDKPPAKNPFAGFSLTQSQSASPTISPAVNGASSPFQIQSNTNSGPSSNNAPTSFNTSSMHSQESGKSPVSRASGFPPTPPDDFNEEQNCQYITGWRLRYLDQGLQTYLEYSSYSEQEIESISTFYHLRKQAILDANGGPVKEINSKRAAASDGRHGGPQSKKARRQAPVQSEQDGQTSRTTSTSNGKSKRKAAEEIAKSTGQAQSNSLKRSKPEDQITYPSLPSSSASQTAKMFGNLVGKKSEAGSSTADSPQMSGSLSNGATHVATASTPAGSSKSSLFSQAPDSSSGHLNQQRSMLNSPASLASDPSQTRPRDSVASGQPLLTQSSSPFKGFFTSQSSQSNANASAGNNSSTPSNFFTTQSSNSSSMFSNLNRGNIQKSPAKRKMNSLEMSGDPADESNSEISQEQHTKKQRMEDDASDSQKDNADTTKAKPTTERTGFGESIFSRPGMLPTSTSNNFFSHIGNPTNDQEDDDADANDDEEADDDDQPRKENQEAKQTTTSNSANDTSSVSKTNAFGSTVFNPFAGSSFSTPKKPADNGEPGGRSLFDRIEKNPEGQPIKAPKDIQDVDLGQSILKAPQNRGLLDSTKQAPGTNIFGGLNSTSTNSNAAPSAFNLFGKPSGSNIAPTANMDGSKEVEESPSSDHTWKAGTPVKFSETSGAPNFNLTSPSPSKTSLSGLFGSPKANSTIEAPAPFSFKPVDAPSTKPAALTFGISAPPKDSLAPPSESHSESTSRATSPGAGESGNEASDQVHEDESHPDLDTTEANRAEEDEDTIFEVKAKAHKLTESKYFNATTGKEDVTRQWTVQGVEQFRILQNRTTKKTRMLIKLKVNGRVILNAGLDKSLNYTLASSKVVRVPVPTENKVESWTIQVGKENDAKELARLLEENKGN
ncbi:MAG: hypothetical protein Q9169_000489 [Polycauliona sp. 2 TL-2023]